MKATIDVSGRLTVIAQSDTEAYALKLWLLRFPLEAHPEAEASIPGPASVLAVDLESFSSPPAGAGATFPFPQLSRPFAS
jgi:hypothetical protein